MDTKIINLLNSIGISNDDININQEIIKLWDYSNIQSIINKLLELNINNEEISEIIICNPLLLNEEIGDINKKISLLELENISNNEIKEILLSNPYFLSNDLNDLSKTINLLKDLGFSLPIILEQAPTILNLSTIDLSSLFKCFEDREVSKTDIVDIFEWRSDLIDLSIDDLNKLLNNTVGYEHIVNLINENF